MIALLLVTIVVGIATVVFARVANSGETPALTRAKEAIESMDAEEMNVHGLIIKREIIPLENTTARRLHFTITNSTGELLYSQDRIE